MEELETLAAYILSKPQPPGKMSFEEFLNWCDEDTWAEWVDGEVIILTPASLSHQLIKKFLCFIMDEFVRSRQAGLVLDAPFLVHLPERLRRGREPDIIFIRSKRLHLLKETYFDGAPDLIVEIISPESYTRDRVVKYNEYEAAGVAEYWLINPANRQAEFFRLGPDGRYYSFAADEQGIYRSDVLPGFWLKVDWLWQDPPPSAIYALREMGVI